MFEPLPAKFDFPQAERRVLELWQKHDVFARSLEQRRGAPRFVFYEGPPTANGLPHPGHCLTRVIKDIFPRYQTMRGYLVERKAGWDTHGLPVEIEVCKQLGIHSKEEIEQFGLDRFVQRCIRSVFRYVRQWEEMTDRLGFWINLDEAYVTYHQSYVESVWWSLKTLFERGLLYQGHKVVWWWPQGGTALSSGEVGEGYRTVEDPSVYIRFPLVGESKARLCPKVSEQTRGTDKAELRPTPESRISLLVWTTTPWTLVSNHFAAVHPLFDYALVYDKTTDEYFYIAVELVDQVAGKLKHDFQVVATCRGEELVGLRYEPPFPEAYYNEARPYKGQFFSRVTSNNWFEGLNLEYEAGQVTPRGPLAEHVMPRWKITAGTTSRIDFRNAEYVHVGWRVVPADFVTLDTGTGIVHQAPAYGEVDFALWLEESKQVFAGLPLLNAVAPDGTFTDEAPQQYRGRWVKDCDDEIMRELTDRGIMLLQETVRHEYPFCPRAEDDPLIQYARKSWFVRTSQFKDEFLKNNDRINWLPEHIREGRFGDFLRNNVDWALSRERYWGTPLPIWVCEKTGRMEAIGSYAELLDKPGVQGTEVWENAKKEDPALPDHLKVHKPYIDAITYDSPFVGEHGPPARMRRVPEVIDCWWDAGCMPFAQWGFPHVEDSVQTFAERFPCDFISEAIDQTRGWFYGLLAISTLLFKDGLPQRGSMGLRPVPPPQPALPTTGDLVKRRRILPHWEAGGCTYVVTFRLYQGELSPDERTFVLEACRHWDGQRMLLHAVVVMPDHVHMLFTPLESAPGAWWSVADLMHSIKGYTATQLNKRRGQTGPFWQQEYFGRIVRTEADFDEKWNYVTTNPRRRGLPDDYPWVWVEPSHGTEEGNGPEAHPRHGPEAHAPRDAYVPHSGYPMPYRTCIVLGHVMGEDGLKMSKRTQNYKEPDYIFDHYGADAMRWYFCSAQTPWTSIRFQEAAIRDAHREFLVRLYNVFSFFNIYANIDGFDPGWGVQGSALRSSANSDNKHGGASEIPRQEQSRALGSPKGWRPAAQRSEIDRWVISELHRTVRVVRERMDRFENFPATGRLNDFVDALSNWYVRRSRERFWRAVEQPQASAGAAPGSAAGAVPRELKSAARLSPQDQDKWDAYSTLYEVLVTLSQTIAPFTPFFAETMYQNLVRHAGTQPPGHKAEEQSSASRAGLPISVHLCAYPEPEEALVDEQLAAQMDLVRQIVSLGRAARTAARLKVRQPLARVEIILARHEHEQWLEAHSDLIAEELNIKEVEFATEADHYVRYLVKANFQKIGPKFGPLAPRIGAALDQTADAAAVRKALYLDGEYALTVDGQEVRLSKDEIEIRLQAKAGWSAAQGKVGVVVVSTELTQELRREGQIRELIHHVQGLRKQQNLPYEARIALYVEAPEEFLNVVRGFADTVRHECLATRIEYAPPPGGDIQTVRVETVEVKLAIETVRS
jgi:isoleucyl-tRNA synthetase